jgi:hypothetical protein
VVPYLFLYFFAEAETNTEILKTNIKTDNLETVKQIWNEYGANTDKKRMMITRTKRPLACIKLKQVK